MAPPTFKVLHTADWHIGKSLHKHELVDEMRRFFDFLFRTIKEKNIDLLLVSGDIFDHSNPSSADRRLYYEVLKSLSDLGVKVIITGGNHDSISMLEAPKVLLESFDITVIGGATDPIDEELIEILDDQGSVLCVVAAVPFLRDKDVRNLQSDLKFETRADAVRHGIKDHYHRLAKICRSRYDVPVIAMGHLFAKGSITSDSERDIHVGNAAAIPSSIFEDIFSYVALGHIHRPQIIGKNPMVRYSGSPVCLSFSEKDDQKQMLLITLEEGVISEPQIIPLPKWREIKKISGTYQEVETALAAYEPDYPLISFVEVEVKEPSYNASMVTRVEELIGRYEDHARFKILKHRISFDQGAKDTSGLFDAGVTIRDLNPKEVFLKRLELEDASENMKQKLLEAYLEILEQID